MFFKKLNLIPAFLIVFAMSILATGCAEDDANEIVGVCPIVLSTIPLDAAINVPLDQVISVTFNEELNPETVNSDTFKVNGGSDLDGTISYSETTAYFTPSVNLLPNTTYTGTVTTGVKNPLGSALQENYSWSFTTLAQVSLTVSPDASGTVSGASLFNNGSTVTVVATSNMGYEFTNWTIDGVEVSTNSNYEFEVNGNMALVANFTLITGNAFTLSINAQNGTVSKNPNQPTYAEGADVILDPTPADGYKFSFWSGDITGSNNPFTVTMDTNKTIIANFTLISENTFTLTVNAENGSVSTNLNGPTYNDGTDVILTPTPANGYEFSSWSGDASGNNNPLTITMDANKVITANFTEVNAGSQQRIVLSSAGDFVVLSGSGITNTGVSTYLTGDVGSFPTATINGLDQTNVNGTLYTTADPIIDAAKSDLTSAYNDGQSRSLNAISLPGQLGGLTLAPGLYVNSTSTGISGTGPQGILTLNGDANAVWIFKMGSTLITDPDTSIVLSGGASADNIFWVVGTSATLGTNSIFFGNILANMSITLNTGASLDGRALTRTGSVSLDSNIATKP